MRLMDYITIYPLIQITQEQIENTVGLAPHEENSYG